MTDTQTFRSQGQLWTRHTREHVRRFVVGVDLARAIDFTAIAVLEYRQVPIPDQFVVNAAARTTTQKVDRLYRLHRLERMQTPYAQVIERLSDMLDKRPLRDIKTDLVVDASGVGVSVVERMREADLDPIEVTITGGYETIQNARNKFSVPKSELVLGLQAKWAAHEFRMPASIARGVMRQEVAQFEEKRTETGKLTWSAAGAGHDDSIVACGLCCWWLDWAEAPGRKSYTWTGIPGSY